MDNEFTRHFECDEYGFRTEIVSKVGDYAAEGYEFRPYVQYQPCHDARFSVAIDWPNLAPLPPHQQWSNEPGYDYLSIPF